MSKHESDTVVVVRGVGGMTASLTAARPAVLDTPGTPVHTVPPTTRTGDATNAH
ncbi:hypothetical protein [Rhodococcus tibetensis]|uniref:Uncharacterized protein n=1 Tax=Rhodococcus tibetensis TaxID=2965064 RepID=A0ABT1Q7F6_9NOCA|nr:hypothetical protein [Rhodococcus sp. FXJ9.536]MCQ4117660.1 hypothetical protein [Rhodococcus sp. FXJ9.536]